MQIRIEEWAGHKIRFVEKDGEWWAVLADICKPLNLKTKYIQERLEDEVVSTDRVLDSIGRTQEMLIVSEEGIYDAIFSSKKQEAKEFKRWVYKMLKQLREATGLEGFQVFRMMDKEHQKEAMSKLCQSLKRPVRVDFIKANTIANKTVSTKFGKEKMVKKAEMTPQMLANRQSVLDDTVDLMATVEKFNIIIPVAETIYRKHLN